MKNMKKVTKICLIGIGIVVLVSLIFICKPEEENKTTYFTFDEKTGETIIVGPDANKWVRAEDYDFDNGILVNYDNVIMHGEEKFYMGSVDGGEYYEASEGYWNSMILSRQKEIFFGYVYIGD